MGPTGRQLRLSGSEEAPGGRGLLHLGAPRGGAPRRGRACLARRPGRGVGLYAAALVALYAVSASYHLRSWAPTARRRMRRVDHEMIFVFIVVSATP